MSYCLGGCFFFPAYDAGDADWSMLWEGELLCAEQLFGFVHAYCWVFWCKSIATGWENEREEGGGDSHAGCNCFPDARP